ncbi:MAG: glucose 1-dehydrogenase [SAR324 cluster bacterium]|jgi:NAD(P)-dependent dehydrogenase (short-subunit alcohol dehydrogenase family)|nr:glucose 1-dehydrogenase [SAR324 cluster bacterium]
MSTESQQEKQSLSGRIAVVTGGCGGIGTAVCARLAREGAQVYAADLRGGDTIKADEVIFHEHDVSSEESAKFLMAEVERQHGRLDILVNAAGIEIEQTIEETSLEDWNRIFAVNVTGTFLTSKHALPLMRKAGSGSIINFGSYDGFIADPALAAYCATKGAVHALTKAMACDHGPENIRVNAICPGFIDTPMLNSFFGSSGDIESLKNEVRRVHPLKRYGTPEDVAGLVNWLAGDEARYASGQLWILDGGLTAQVQQMRL